MHVEALQVTVQVMFDSQRVIPYGLRTRQAFGSSIEKASRGAGANVNSYKQLYAFVTNENYWDKESQLEYSDACRSPLVETRPIRRFH